MERTQILNKWQNEYGQGTVYKIYETVNGRKEFKAYQTKLKKLDGSVKQFTKKNKENLIEQIAGLIRQIDEGKIVVPRPKTTLIQSINYYVYCLEEKRGEGKISTSNFNQKNGNAQKIINILYGDDTLSNRDIRDWQSSDTLKLMNYFKKRTQSANVLGTYLKIIQDSFFNSMNTNDFDAKDQNPIVQFKKNPVNMIDLKIDTETHRNDTMKLIEKWDFKMVKEFKETIENRVLRLVISICFSCGLRISEVLGLLTKDFIDNTGNYVPKLDVYSQIDRDGFQRNVKTSAGNRYVPLGTGLADELRNYIKHRNNDPFTKNNEILFPLFKDGKTMWHNYRTAHKELVPYLIGKFELPNNHKFHFFRHWCVTMWKRNAIYNGYDISRFIGHKNESVTARVYTHLFCKQLEEQDRCDKDDYINNRLF